MNFRGVMGKNMAGLPGTSGVKNLVVTPFNPPTGKRMKHHNPPNEKSRGMIRIIAAVPLCLCCVSGQVSNPPGKPTGAPPAMIESLRRIGSTEGFKPYDGNPILKPGPAGSFDAGALGSMCVLRVGDVLHLYYMYYWYGWEEPQAFKLITSATSTGFDLNEAKTLTVAGDDSPMCKFGHVLRDDDGWHLFYSNFEDGHCSNSIVRYATSTDGIHWQARVKGLVKGHDADVLRIADDLYLMVYSPQGGFDAKGTDIRLAVYTGRLPELVNKPPLVPAGKPR